MPTSVEIFQIICLIPIISGCIYLILSVWTIRNFLRKTTTDINTTEKFHPPVTVLKPIRGIEKNLKSNLHTITVQDWPEYQIIYSVQDPQDSALPILNQLQAEVDLSLIHISEPTRLR